MTERPSQQYDDASQMEKKGNSSNIELMQKRRIVEGVNLLMRNQQLQNSNSKVFANTKDVEKPMTRRHSSRLPSITIKTATPVSTK